VDLQTKILARSECFLLLFLLTLAHDLLVQSIAYSYIRVDRECLIPGVYRIPSIVRRLTRPRRTCHLSGEEPLLQRCLGAMDITQIVRQLRCYSEDHGLRLAKVDELQPTAKELLCSLSEELELIR
jgi:hypothetical protein